MKVSKLIYGEGFTKKINGYDKAVRIYNESEHIVNGEKDIKAIHNSLREEVALLNQKELNEYLKNY